MAQYYLNRIHYQIALDKIILFNKGVDKSLLHDVLSEQFQKPCKIIDRKHPSYAGLQKYGFYQCEI